MGTTIEAHKLLESISASKAKVKGDRSRLEATMSKNMRLLTEKCHQYLAARASLETLGTAQCNAVQGRVNVAASTEGTSSAGCVDDLAEEGGAAVPLKGRPCASGHTQLLCSRRLEYLKKQEPAPDDPEGGLSMDAQVRKWCHPPWYMPAPPISDELSYGLKDPRNMDFFVSEEERAGGLGAAKS